MQIFLHLFHTKNIFGKDSISEQKMTDLSSTLTQGIELQGKCISQTWDQYNLDDKEALKKILLSQDPDVFHIILPGGQSAQEYVYSILFKQNPDNVFVVYNSNWDIGNKKNLQFGKIPEIHHFNLGEFDHQSDINEALSGADLKRATMMFQYGLFKEAFPQPALTGNLAPVEQIKNFNEMRSGIESRHDDIWERAKIDLPMQINQIVDAIQNPVSETSPVM